MTPLASGSLACAAEPAVPAAAASMPWMDKALSPQQRAEMVLKQMTLDEKIELLHGNGMPGWGKPEPNEYLGNGGAGFVLGIPRLGLPFILMSDAAYGVRWSAQNGRYSTALPSNLASAASWDPQAACSYGALIGSELRAQGYNMTLGGGTNLTREPRNGRTFEYLGEDPVLSGTLVGNRINCEQAQHVVGDIKHYAVNDEETGRNEVNSVIDKRSMREGDLLAFEIGIKVGDPAAVMCSYNAVNGFFACENKYLLTDVLRNDFHFKGFVLSDWGGTHSTVNASHAGLDNEQPLYDFFGPKLKQAVENGSVSMEELDNHVRHMLYGEFVSGIVDYPTEKSVIDIEHNLEVSRHIAEQSTVLLKNEGAVLPIDRSQVHSIAVIGENADTGMISGGGSAQVDPPGRPAGKWQEHIWFPTSPLKAIQAKAPGAQVRFASGKDVAEAAALAKSSDVVLVFAYQWESEGMDLKNLSLPDNQDALIEAVAKANPKTVVVLETGTAVTMPWVNQVSGVVESWYAGSKGADAVANVLFGDVNPSAKLPMTFPRTEADLPHPALVIPPAGALGKDAVLRTGKPMPTFSMHYDEGLKVGYKWYDAEHKDVLFPFGFGLSYTTYSYSGLQVTGGHDSTGPTVRFTVKNTGSRAGQEVAEIYASLPEGSGEPPKRLVGFSKVALAPGESKEVSVSIDPKYLSIFDVDHDAWKLLPGSYTIMVGGSSKALDLSQKLELQ
jgi:beta-glucosidase